MPATIQPTVATHPLFNFTLPVQNQEDPVLKAAQKILSIHNSKNKILCHVSLPLSLEALPYTSVDPGHGRYYRISRASLLGNYPEYSNYDGMWDTVVRIRLSSKTVQVRDGDTWLPLGDYLSQLPAVKEYWAGPGSSQWRQVLAWNTNGQTFPLMDLPGEIRNMIYDYSASFCYPYEFEHGFNYMAAAGTDGLLYRDYGRAGTHLQAELFGRGRVLNGAGPVLALLLTSKRVHAEFAARLFRNMDFRFQAAPPLRRFLKPLPPSRSLAKVTLQMTTWNFIKFFGIRLDAAAPRPWPDAPEAEALRGLRLRELELRLGHREDFAAGADFRLDAALAPCCHRVLVGLILWAAKDFVRDVPIVTVEGCVPAKAKAAFLQLLRDEKEGVAPSAVTEWDVVGGSKALVERGESWEVRSQSGLGCGLLDHEHSCADMGPCTDEFCLAENEFAPKRIAAAAPAAAEAAEVAMAAA